jgi:ATP-dependent DNA helicase RecG
MPESWSVEELLNKHSSRPCNPDISNAFFRSAYVESWGRGVDKIKNLPLLPYFKTLLFFCLLKEK